MTSASIPPSAENSPPFGHVFPARVTRVVDGDTLEIVPTRPIMVRVLGCDTPELHPKSGTPAERQAERARALASKAKLEALVLGREVKVFIPLDQLGHLGDASSFGRALADLWRLDDGLSLGQEMLRDGDAKPIPRDSP